MSRFFRDIYKYIGRRMWCGVHTSRFRPLILPWSHRTRTYHVAELLSLCARALLSNSDVNRRAWRTFNMNLIFFLVSCPAPVWDSSCRLRSSCSRRGAWKSDAWRVSTRSTTEVRKRAWSWRSLSPKEFIHPRLQRRRYPRSYGSPFCRWPIIIPKRHVSTN